MGSKVVQSLSGRTVSALRLPAYEDIDPSVNSDPEYVEVLQQEGEIVGPLLLFDDVFYEQVDPCSCECRNRTMESCKELFSPRRPRDRRFTGA
jgi:hypothetical protein